ncbi:tubulin-specific chaperone E-like [Tubulanus polymorphus]|uniref:tubulin-specific chaperone E-like n=1 Tax=Tubulanus polymorphus TaxID=672921 RepID=UPI003DA5FE6C
MYRQFKQQQETMVKNDIEVGSRIVCDGFIATVRYMGTVPPTEGQWLGVEWDDSERGKHDGSKDGIVYFKTSSPTGGSFIRPKKAEVGMSCFAAVNERYGLIDETDANTDKLFINTGRNKTTTSVELVGFDKVNKKQSEFEKLEEVVLRNMKVFGAASYHLLSQNVANIIELDLSQNLIPSWEEVSKITNQLKLLKSLNISENRLTLPENPSKLKECFSSLQTLYMNRMKLQMSFSDILFCSEMWPNLENLHICFLELQTLTNPRNLLNRLKILNLESNPLDNWDEVMKLSSLKRLETLVLNGTGLDQISLPGNPTEKTTAFTNLLSLSLSRNKISEWSSINELNKLMKLEEIRFKKNPLCETVNVETLRQLLIAKLGNLKVCDRTEVTTAERKGSEIDYLKRFGPMWLEAGGNSDPILNKPSAEFILQHPRYQHIVEHYGAAEQSEMKQQSTTLKDNLISVSITCPQSPPKKTLTKKLPLTMTVQKVKTLVNRLLKADISTLKLSYISKDTTGPEIDLDNDLRQLSFYSVENGDTLIAKWCQQ